MSVRKPPDVKQNYGQILKEFYSTGAEDKRLKEDKAHQVEFLTTTRYINKFLKDNDKILEVRFVTFEVTMYSPFSSVILISLNSKWFWTTDFNLISSKVWTVATVLGFIRM